MVPQQVARASPLFQERDYVVVFVVPNRADDLQVLSFGRIARFHDFHEPPKRGVPNERE